MIITLKGADFSESKIGTLDTWTIFTTLGRGATYSGDKSVDRGAAFSGTVTLADGYEVSTAGVTVTMGGATLTDAVTIDGNTITISISSVTGTVNITVPTVSISGGGDVVEPDTPTPDTPDDGDEIVNFYNVDIVNQYYKGGCFLASNATWYSSTAYYSTNLIPINREGAMYWYGFKETAEMQLTWYDDSATEGTPTVGAVGVGNVTPVGGFITKKGLSAGGGGVTVEWVTDSYGQQCFKFNITKTYNSAAKYIRLGYTSGNLSNGTGNVFICHSERVPD